MENKTLTLNLIKQWFNLTLQGIKKEEYRALTVFWLKQLCTYRGEKLSIKYTDEALEVIIKRIKEMPEDEWQYVFEFFGIRFKRYDTTDFRNGYKPLNEVPRFIIENEEITIGKGNTDWGYIDDGDVVIVIHHGEVLKKFNIK